MPLFDYLCRECNIKKEVYVKRYDDEVVCDKCGSVMAKCMPSCKFTYKTGDFFEPYMDETLDNKPILIKSKEHFYAECRKRGKVPRAVKDKLR